MRAIAMLPRFSRVSKGNASSSHRAKNFATTAQNDLRIILIGFPGAGKGTQAAKIQRDFGCVPISTGDELRKIAKQGGPLAETVQKVMESGAYVSDDIMIRVVEQALGALSKPSWLLDGFPRSHNQAVELDKLLQRTKQPLSAVFFLNVAENVILERLASRWVHPASGRIYNVGYKPPKVAGKDDITGEPLVQRLDDNADTIRTRLKTFNESTAPLIDFYKKDGRLIIVDSPTSDIGYVKIHEVLSKLAQKTTA